MVVLELPLPIMAYQCMALLRRLHKNHPIRPTIERDLRAWLKGYYGEKECSYYLSLLPEDRYYIFHGLRLIDKRAFQIDLMIISARFIFIGEVKNLSKKLIFHKEFNHVTKEFNHEEEGISNPILQVKRQKLQFDNWLRNMQMSGLPIERAVIISKSTTLLETTNKQVLNEVMYAESLLDKLDELEMKYSNPVFTKRKLNKLVNLLLTHHQTPIPDILPTYKLTKADIKPGVLCPRCQTMMSYYSTNWHCSQCHLTSKTAHFPAVDDYFLLLGPTITRKQYGEFLGLKSTHTAGKQLRTLPLQAHGAKRGTHYTLPNNMLLSPLTEKEINAYTIPVHTFPSQ